MARAPARPRADDDDAPRPRKRTPRFEDEYDEAPRRSPGKSNNALLYAGSAAVFGFVGLAFVGVLAWLLVTPLKSSQTVAGPAPNFDPLPQMFAPPAPNPQAFVPPLGAGFDPLPIQRPNAPAAPANAKLVISNARWSVGGPAGGDFEVDYEFHDGRKPFGGTTMKLAWKYANGSTGSASLNFLDAAGSLKIRVIAAGGPGGRGIRGGMEIWVEEGIGGIARGTKVSNSVTLN